MALTRVRVQFNGTWTVLSYNAATGRYEGEITPAATSRHQPGGYYNLTAEAANDSGQVSSVSGTALRGLRLVVRETVSPALTLVSPPQGYVTTRSPAVVFQAADEAGGSGVDPESFAVTLDGAAQAAGLSTEAAEGGFLLRFTPPSPLTEGPHVLTFSVSDRDGNAASASAAYTVDVTPPELELTEPDSHYVVDVPEITFSGRAADSIAGPPAVTITVNGTTAAEPVLSGGVFSAAVPLEVGVNEIAVTARDGAGLETVRTYRFIRLVTDRTAADLERVRDLLERGLDRWTEAERTWFHSARCHRGAYDFLDWNRVELAAALVDGWASGYGNETGYAAPPGVWTGADGMTEAQGARYLGNVAGLWSLFGALGTALELPPPLPESLNGLNTGGANQIEAALVAVDALRPLLERSFWQSGEIACGEV